MSYDIQLSDPVTGETLCTAERHQIRGGTYQMGGTTQMWLSITYNYAKHFHPAFKEFEDADRLDGFDGKPLSGIRILYGKTGAESIPILKAVIAKLGDDVDADYWKPTEGNAKRALLGLLAFAQMRPDGIWDGD